MPWLCHDPSLYRTQKRSPCNSISIYFSKKNELFNKQNPNLPPPSVHRVTRNDIHEYFIQNLLKSESKSIPLQGKKCNNAANTLHDDNITRQIPTETHKPSKQWTSQDNNRHPPLWKIIPAEYNLQELSASERSTGGANHYTPTP